MWFYEALGLAVILFGTDQFMKFWVAAHLALAESISLIPGVLSLTDVRNCGAAWSILQNQRCFFILVAFAALGIIIYYLWECRYDYRYDFTLSLLMAGTGGNLLSRLLSRSVVDMFQLDFVNFPVFNVADGCLTVGILILMVLISMNRNVKGSQS